MKWNRGRNPYTQSLFQVLAAGPDVLPSQVVQLANDLLLEFKGGRPRILDGRPISASEIQEASAQLRDPERLAEERLLAHAVPQPSSSQVDTAAYRSAWLRLALELFDSGGLPECHPGRADDDEDRACDQLFDA